MAYLVSSFLDERASVLQPQLFELFVHQMIGAIGQLPSERSFCLYSLIKWPVVHTLVILPFMPVLAHLSHNELNGQHFLLVSLCVHVTCVVCIQRC